MATSNNIISLRRHDLDNLRTFLTALVTVHHTSIAYGGAGGWPFKSAAFVGTSPLILGFNMFNQSFFMGIFFWISGRVSAQALQRATSLSGFLKTKTLRLAVPALAYTLVVNPIMHAMLQPNLSVRSAVAFVQNYFVNLRGVRGPVWYTATLLCFDAVAGLIATSQGRFINGNKRAHLYELLRKYGWLAAAVFNFLAKTQYPVGRALPIINLQPAYMFQYIYAYALGYLGTFQGEQILGSPFDGSSQIRHGKRDASPGIASVKGISLGNAFMMSVLSLTVIFLPRYLDSTNWLDKTTEQLFGGWNLPSLLYAVWNELSFKVFGPALMFYFQQKHNQQATHATWNARYSYAAFLLHTPVTVILQVLAESLMFSDLVKTTWIGSSAWQALGPVVMTVSVGMASAWASTCVASMLFEWIPALKKIV
ncbi:hypothetical protein G7054_g2902 [Neopestalotiopsis clavispora]|nr:hypothetical protein G7054_g2902 [Neopestalotiopsis clavispora]